MTSGQAKLLADFGPFRLTAAGVIVDVNGMGMWEIAVKPPVMNIDRAIVAALNHIVAEELDRQKSERTK